MRSPLPARVRRPGTVVLALALALVLLTGLLGAVGASVPAAAQASLPATRAAADPPPPRIPGPGDDFARLPDSCYEQSDRYFILNPCQVTTFAKRPYLVAWGDSHVLQYLPALQSLATEHRVNLVMLVSAGCPVSKPFPASAGESRAYCDDSNERSFAYLQRLSARVARVHVVVAGYYSGYRANYAIMQKAARQGRPSGLSDYVEHLARLGVERTRPVADQLASLRRPVTFVAQAATVPADARRCARGEDPYQCDLARSRALPDEAGNRRFLATHLVSRVPRGRLVTPSRLYCDDAVCRAHIGGVDTFWDHYHLSARLAQRTKPWFRPVFTALAPRPRDAG